MILDLARAMPLYAVDRLAAPAALVWFRLTVSLGPPSLQRWIRTNIVQT